MIRGLLLAGGAAERFGSPKLLHPFAPGQTLGQASARNLVDAVGPVLAVVREGDEELASRLRETGCEVLVTARSRGGLGESLAAGVAASPSAAGWIVALGDMPFVPREAYQAVMLALASGAAIAVPVDKATGQRGHPVGFAASLGEELAALTGDAGARSVIERHAPRVVEIPLADAGIFRDIDTPADLPR